MIRDSLLVTARILALGSLALWPAVNVVQSVEQTVIDLACENLVDNLYLSPWVL